MIAGGRLQDRYGPKIGATGGGLFLAAGCILSGLLKSYLGLILGFGTPETRDAHWQEPRTK